MKKHFSFIVLFILTFNFAFGQTFKSTDTSQLNIRGSSIYYIDGVRAYSKLTKSDSIKLLKEVVSNLNGFWKSDSNSSVAKFIISDRTFKGQLLLPFEEVQQVSPFPIELTIRFGFVSLIILSDSLRISVSVDKLTIEKDRYHKQKK